MEKHRPNTAVVLRFFLALSLLLLARPAYGEKKDEQVLGSPSSCEVNENKGDEQWDFLKGLSQEEAIVKWIQSLEGGIVNNELFEIQRIEYTDGSLNPEFDFIASADISKGTVLMEIPPQAMIGGILTSSEELAVDQFTERVRHISEELHIPKCMAIERIANERQKKSSSSYHPYLEFIFGSGNPKHRKPTEWSNPFFSLFWSMLGWDDSEYLDRQAHYGLEYTEICKTYKKYSQRYQRRIQVKNSPGKNEESWQEHSAEIEDQAYAYFSKHAWGTSMIPLFDMIPHRNGKWKNIEAQYVDTKTEIPIALKPRDERFEGFRRQTKDRSNNKNKLVVYAHRDIAKGEPLRISLNQCEHLGCEHLNLEYTTSDLLTDTGILEEYPRRWSLRMEGSQSFILEIDLDSSSMDPQRRTVRILQSNKPTDELYKLAFFYASRHRWTSLQRELEEIESEDSWNITTSKQKHQYNMIHTFRKGVTEAFELAWLHRYDDANLHQTSQNTTQNAIEGYDDLSERKGPALHSKGGYMVCFEGEPYAERKLLGEINSFYQKLKYFYKVGQDDTFMKMGPWTHSGSSFRAHYHESVIHGALQYVKNPKRVAYIGGGDNMILTELFKYGSIEKIVGLELDQQVCRSSMKYFGTSPSYHDERVEWWYGNGAHSIQLLPDDYFGSFDLVLVDLLTDVADAIKVTAGLSLSEVATLLMKPDGVLARNDDFLDRSEISQRFAKRVVMHDFFDAPHLCEVGVTLASNSIDFANGPRYDHGIETLVRNTDFENERFAGWARYYDQPDSSEKLAYEKSNFEAEGDGVCQGIKSALKEDNIIPSSTSNGILLIIEAENVTKSLEPETLPHLHEMIEEVANAHSLHPLAISYQPESDVHSFVLLCERGYIKMQTYPQFEYVAFDLVLWGDSLFVGKSNDIQNDLIALVGGGSTEGSVSKFRVVSGGMQSTKTSDENNNYIVEKALQYYCGDKNTKIDAEDQDGDFNMNQEMSTQTVDQSFLFPQYLSDITASMANQIDQKSLFVIFCGQRDIEECQSYSSLSSNTSRKLVNEQVFIPIYSCESFDQMPVCESEIKTILQDSVSKHKLFDGFIVDPSVSLNMGKIIHKIFNNTLYQSQMFEQSFSGVAKGGKESWGYIFLDRFRTEIVIAPPVRMAELELSNGTHSEAWSVVSVQNKGFWATMQNFIQTIQSKTGLITKMREILDSIKPIVTDWNPPERPTDYDFFREEVMDQWLGQRPVANQFFLRMEVGSTPAPVEVDEVVLVGEQGSWIDGVSEFVMVYHEGTIVEVNGDEKDRYIAKIEPYQLKDGQTIELKYKSKSADKTIPRHQIRKISRTEANRQLKIGDLVLVNRRYPSTKEFIPVTWIAAYITEMNENGISVRPKGFAEEQEEASDFANLSIDNIMLYSESPEFSIRKEGLNLEKLGSAFEQSALKSGIARNDILFKTFKVSNGYLLSFVSQKGSGIMKWDGVDNVEVNVLATEGRFEENFDSTISLFAETFLSDLPSLNLIAQDSFPRGFGKVVNFQHEIVDFEDDDAPTDHIPLWMEE